MGENNPPISDLTETDGESSDNLIFETGTEAHGDLALVGLAADREEHAGKNDFLYIG